MIDLEFDAKIQIIVIQLQLVVMLLTFWAKSLDDEAGTLHRIAFWQADFGDGVVFKAEGGAAMLAVEMDVHVVVDGMVMAVAEFVAGPFAVFHNMNKMCLLEKRQGAENA